MEYKDYYQIMGVARDASADDIKRAYRRLARKYHPDVSKEKDAEERFKEIGEAYEVLRDPEKRAAYDALGRANPVRTSARRPTGSSIRGGRADPGAHSDFFEQLFGGLGGRRGSFRSRGFDTAGQVEVTLEEAFRGTERRLVAAARRSRRARPAAARDAAARTCGFPPASSTVSRSESRRRGNPAPAAGRRATCSLQVRLLPHRWFRAEGRDIWLDLPVTPWEAALGETVRVPTLGGRVDLKLPKGSQTDRQLRLRGRGLPGNPPGDQFVVLKIMAPPPNAARRGALQADGGYAAVESAAAMETAP